MNTIAGGVDGAQLRQVVSGVAQTSERLKHLLHSRMGSLRGQLFWVCTSYQHTHETHTLINCKDRMMHGGGKLNHICINYLSLSYARSRGAEAHSSCHWINPGQVTSSAQGGHTNNHTYRQFRATNAPNMHVFGVWEEAKVRESPQRKTLAPPDRTQDLLAVRSQY